MVGAVAIRLKDPVFESQTKNKLGNAELRSELVARVREAVVDLLHRSPKAAERALVSKIGETVKLRKELQSIKKMARERARATSIRVPQLKDCKVHFDKRTGRGAGSMIFITEGQSAAGSIVSCSVPVLYRGEEVLALGYWLLSAAWSGWLEAHGARYAWEPEDELLRKLRSDAGKTVIDRPGRVG